MFGAINIADVDPIAAVDKLELVIQTHTELIRLQAIANQLALDAILAESESTANRKRELDLIAQKQAMDREAENRRDSRLNEVIQRMIAQAERDSDRVSQMSTMDDAFRDTVERSNEKTKANTDAIHDLEKAVYALLTRSLDELQSARGNIKARLEKRDLLAVHYDTLHKLEMKAARRGGDVPVSLANDIEAARAAITELESSL